MASEFKPVSTAAELATLDDAEIISGYRDGLRGEPEPGNNRTRSYWHGWRNGMVDSGRRASDWAQRALVRDTRDDGMLVSLFGVSH